MIFSSSTSAVGNLHGGHISSFTRIYTSLPSSKISLRPCRILKNLHHNLSARAPLPPSSHVTYRCSIFTCKTYYFTHFYLHSSDDMGALKFILQLSTSLMEFLLYVNAYPLNRLWSPDISLPPVLTRIFSSFKI